MGASGGQDSEITTSGAEVDVTEDEWGVVNCDTEHLKQGGGGMGGGTLYEGMRDGASNVCYHALAGGKMVRVIAGETGRKF